MRCFSADNLLNHTTKGAQRAEQKKTVGATVRSIRRATRNKYAAEEKVRIVPEGLRGESTIAELCRKEGIQPNLYYKWSTQHPQVPSSTSRLSHLGRSFPSARGSLIGKIGSRTAHCSSFTLIGHTSSGSMTHSNHF
jgi:hypothetical protein